MNQAANVEITASATPTISALPLRLADFDSLASALDYAAQGESGTNFYAGSGKLATVLPYRTLRKQAQTLAKRLLSFPLERGARVAIVAETNPDFLRFFFACQYAGLVPVALPAVIHVGGHKAYVNQLNGLLKGCRASLAVSSSQLLPFLTEAAEGLGLQFVNAAAAFDEPPVAVRLVGAIDIEFQITGLVEVQHLDAGRPETCRGDFGRGDGTAHPVASGGERIDEEVDGRSCADADDGVVGEELEGGFGCRLLAPCCIGHGCFPRDLQGFQGAQMKMPAFAGISIYRSDDGIFITCAEDP